MTFEWKNRVFTCSVLHKVFRVNTISAECICEMLIGSRTERKLLSKVRIAGQLISMNYRYSRAIENARYTFALIRIIAFYLSAELDFNISRHNNTFQSFLYRLDKPNVGILRYQLNVYMINYSINTACFSLNHLPCLYIYRGINT